jgi:hypothetical protein
VRKVVLLVLLACATAHADKSEDTAKYLSGGGGAVAGGVLLFSFLDPPMGEPFNKPALYTGLGLAIVTPSLGEFYAGEWFTPGMAIRLASGALAVYAVQNEEELVRCDTASSVTQPMCKQLKGAGIALVGVAAIGFVGGMWYDALDAGDAVNRWRSRHGIIVAPTVGATTGVSIGGSF